MIQIAGLSACPLQAPSIPPQGRILNEEGFIPSILPSALPLALQSSSRLLQDSIWAAPPAWERPQALAQSTFSTAARRSFYCQSSSPSFFQGKIPNLSAENWERDECRGPWWFLQFCFTTAFNSWTLVLFSFCFGVFYHICELFCKYQHFIQPVQLPLCCKQEYVIHTEMKSCLTLLLERL